MHLLHMPFYSDTCCAMVEVVQKSKHASSTLGHSSLAGNMGALYTKIEMHHSDAQAQNGAKELAATVAAAVSKFIVTLNTIAY
jgi:hypothetical protein